MRAASLTIWPTGRTGLSPPAAAVVRTHDPLQREHVGLGDLAGEVAHVLVGRRADDFVGRADLDDLAVAHDEDPVTELERLGEVVGDEDHRLADLFVEPDDLVLHVAADQRVERRERLVEHQDRGVAGQCPGEADALLHATGELVGEVVLVAGQADQVDHLLGPVAPLSLALAPHLEAERHVVDHLAVGQQAEVLEDHRHLAPPGVEQRGVAHAGDVVAIQLDRALGRLDQAGQQADQRRLARAGQAHDHEHLAGRDLERDVADADDVAGLLLEVLAGQVGLLGTDDLVGPGAEDLPQVLDANRRFVGELTVVSSVVLAVVVMGCPHGCGCRLAGGAGCRLGSGSKAQLPAQVECFPR